MDENGVGESCWPPPGSAAAAGLGAHGLPDVRKEIHDRLGEIGNEEAVGDPCFGQLLDQHFERLPASYSIDLNVHKAGDVLLHRRILAECADHERRPVFHARFLRCIQEAKPQQDAGSSPTQNGNGGCSLASNLRNGELGEVEPCKKMEDLSLERRKGVDDFEAISARAICNDILEHKSTVAGLICSFHMKGHPLKRDPEILLHETIFSSVDKPKLLSQLSALLSELGLNIREAHVFSTIDGFCLGVFVVDGWHTEETDGLLQRLKETAKRSHTIECWLDLVTTEWDEAGRMPPNMYRCFTGLCEAAAQGSAMPTPAAGGNNKVKVFGGDGKVWFAGKRVRGKLAMWEEDEVGSSGGKWDWVDGIPGYGDGVYRGFVFDGGFTAMP